MRSVVSTFSLVVTCAVLLAGCAQISPRAAVAEAEAAAVDDEAFCRGNGGPPGSNGFAACMKDRDAMRAQQAARADRTHNRLVEGMLNGR
jgi:hypothetical protein